MDTRIFIPISIFLFLNVLKLSIGTESQVDIFSRNETNNYTLLQQNCHNKHNLSSTGILCIPKCCPMNEVLDFGGLNHGELQETGKNAECVDSGGKEWSPLIKEDFILFHKNLSNCFKGEFVHYNGLAHIPSDKIDPGKIQHSIFEILPDGSLIHTVDGFEMILSPDQDDYCLDGVQNFYGGIFPEKYSGLADKHSGLVVCYEELEENIAKEIRHTLVYLYIFPFATLFLVATIIVYILVWETINIHGYVLFSYVCSLCGNNCFLFLSQLGVVSHYTKGCTFIGICTHFLFLQTTSFLTAINFDVFHTFKHLKAGKASKSLAKYLQYCAFAVGVPFLIVFISGVIDAIYSDNPNPPIILPHYTKACVLSHNSVLYYLYIPFGILICSNFLFFIWTIVLLSSYQKSIRAVLKGTCTEKEDQSLRLFLKLFVVCGFSWSFEVIGWAIKKYFGEEWEVGATVDLIDSFNVLLAIPISFIFVWKRPFFDHLWLKYRILRRPLSLLVSCGCVSSTPDEKRPSISAMTMSTLGRNGTLKSKRGSGSTEGKRISSGSVTDLIKNRKKSSDSRQYSFEKKFSNLSTTSSLGEGGMSVLIEEKEEQINDEIIQNPVINEGKDETTQV